jgi:hypothetical protein
LLFHELGLEFSMHRWLTARARKGQAVMTVLLIALFCGAGILAVASMVANIRHHAAAVIAIARQHGRGGGLPDPVQRKHLVYARRLKAQPGWRAKARARRTGRDLRPCDRPLAGQGNVVRKSVHNRHSGFIMAHLSDTLATE